MSTNPLQQYRHKNDLSRAELAKMLDCSESMIGHIERGFRNISPYKAKEWSPILGIPKEKLCPSIFA